MKKILRHILTGLFALLSSYAFAQISTNPNDYLLRLKSEHGYLYGGPNDSLRSYLMTDLPEIYINKPLLVNSIGSYNGNFSLFTNTTNITIIDSTGYVGIGLTNPLEMLHLNGNIRGNQTGGALRIQTNYGYTDIGAQGSLASHLYTNLPAFYFNKRLMLETGELTSYNGDLKLLTSGIKQITIQNTTGNVGIGSTTPQAKLHVVGSLRAYQDTITSNYIELRHFGNYGTINSVGIGGTLFQNNGFNSLFMDSQGRVSIGNVNSFPGNYKLYVQGGILTERVRVAIQNTNDWSDYVFAETYPLKKIEEVEDFVKIHKHLPNVPSAQDMVNTGLDVAEMDAKLLEKIEEAFLYIIELNKKVKALELENKQLKINKEK